MTSHRVLVVEDDAEIREIVTDILREYGFDVLEASNGAEALAVLQADPLPCIILLDLMMPVMDGEAFREAQLREPRLARIPVVVISAYLDLRVDLDRLQAAGYLKKPPRIEELVSVIEQHC